MVRVLEVVDEDGGCDRNGEIGLLLVLLLARSRFRDVCLLYIYMLRSVVW